MGIQTCVCIINESSNKFGYKLDLFVHNVCISLRFAKVQNSFQLVRICCCIFSRSFLTFLFFIYVFSTRTLENTFFHFWGFFGKYHWVSFFTFFWQRSLQGCFLSLSLSLHGKSMRSKCFEVLRFFLFVSSTILHLAITMRFLAMKTI